MNIGLFFLSEGKKVQLKTITHKYVLLITS